MLKRMTVGEAHLRDSIAGDVGARGDGHGAGPAYGFGLVFVPAVYFDDASVGEDAVGDARFSLWADLRTRASDDGPVEVKPFVCWLSHCLMLARHFSPTPFSLARVVM